MRICKINPGSTHLVLKYDSHIPVTRLEDCIRSGQVYALWDGETVVGILRYSLFWQTIPFLDLIYIDKAYCGKGHGRRMMARWERDMAQLGYDCAMLSTQADETARFFYEKLGWRHVGGFCPPGQAAEELIYAKKL